MCEPVGELQQAPLQRLQKLVSFDAPHARSQGGAENIELACVSTCLFTARIWKCIRAIQIWFGRDDKFYHILPEDNFRQK